MTNARQKDFIREIKKNPGRFLSIVFIVLLGAAFFAGLRSSSADMKASADLFYDRQKLMDLRVISNQGITERELDEIKDLDGVSLAEGVCWTDTVLDTEHSELVVRMTSMTDEVNLPEVSRGRLPEKDDECLFDSMAMKEAGLKIGDTITVKEETGDREREEDSDSDKDQVLRRHRFTIVGAGSLPYFTDTYRGSSSAGDGSLDAFALVTADTFDMPVYTEADLLVRGAGDELYAGKAYDDLVKSVSDRIADWSDKDRRTDQEMADTFDFELPSPKDLEDIQEGLNLKKTREEKISEAQDQAVETALQEIEDQILKAQMAAGLTEEQVQEGLKMQETTLEQMAEAQLTDEKKNEIRQTAAEEAGKKIDDAVQKAEDAQSDVDKLNDKLEELENPEWNILDWNAIESSLTYEQNADRIWNLSQVLPVMFFLVAALVSLTAMTRMVDEQREAMGTMKALGYTTAQIAEKYLFYAILATLAGSIVGVCLGEKYLTLVVVRSYGTVYPGLTVCITPFNWGQALLAVIASAASTGFATIAACVRQLRATPAELMRPEPPKGGKRVWLENISFIWNRMSFTWKSTYRNLFRYKKRFFMTIIGIGGCMGLLLIGFGLRDSISIIAKRQYSAVLDYDAAVTVKQDASEKDLNACGKYAGSLKGCETTACMEKTYDLYAGQKSDASYTATVIVPEDPDRMDEDFFHLNDRKSRERYDFPEKGAAISEKTAQLLGVKAGDSIYLETDGGRIRVPVQLVFENYMSNYLLMSPEVFHTAFGEDYQKNTMLVRKSADGGYSDKMTPDEERDLADGFMSLEAVKGISFISDEYSSIENMLGILDKVLVIIVLAAGLLALVVIYNLNSINITERKRELATLKVLGFYDGEVASYV